MAKQWFIVHTYSGFEKKVSESLRQRANAYDREDQIGRIEMPTEEVVEMKGGKKVQTATRFFPGYILVEIETEEKEDEKGPSLMRTLSPRSNMYFGLGFSIDSFTWLKIWSASSWERGTG